MRILIIEDEKSQINKLKCFFKDSFPEFTIDYAPTYHEARIKIIESNFDIGIFDILLKDKLIFEILDGVNFDTKEIIFLTGDHSYTHKAFECYAIDYILKPYDSRRLFKSIQKAHERLELNRKFNIHSRIPSFTKAVVDDKIEFIALPNLNGIKLVSIKEIVAVEAARSYSTFHLVNKETVTISKSLSWAEVNLRDMGFFRVHRSWLVSRIHITDFIRQNGYSLKLTTGLIVAVTERTKSVVLDWIKSFSISD